MAPRISKTSASDRDELRMPDPSSGVQVDPADVEYREEPPADPDPHAGLTARERWKRARAIALGVIKP